MRNNMDSGLTRHFHSAPWGRALKVISCLASLLLLTVSIILWFSVGLPPVAKILVCALPLLIVIPSLFFVVRGYTVKGDTLLIHRLGWTTTLPMSGLKSVSYEPNAMSNSIRLFGNGGLFSFTGLFRNKHLGNYRAFVSDLNRTVVLRLPQRTLVVSPEVPERFVEDLTASRKLPEQ